MPFSKAGRKFGTASIYPGKLRMYVQALESGKVKYWDNKGVYSSPGRVKEIDSPARAIEFEQTPTSEIFLNAGQTHTFTSTTNIVGTVGTLPCTGIVFSTANIICSTATHKGTDSSPNEIRGSEVLTPLDTNLFLRRANPSMQTGGQNFSSIFGNDDNSSPNGNLIFDLCQHQGSIQINGKFKNSITDGFLDMVNANHDDRAEAVDGWYLPGSNDFTKIELGHAEFFTPDGDSTAAKLTSTYASLVHGQEYTLTYTIFDKSAGDNTFFARQVDLAGTEVDTEIPCIDGTHTVTFTSAGTGDLTFLNSGSGQRFKITDIHLKGSTIINSIKGFGARNDSPLAGSNSFGEGFILAASASPLFGHEIFAAAVNDSDGQDLSGGIAKRQMSDTYLFANTLKGYTIITPYDDNEVTVKYQQWDSDSETNEYTYTTHNLSANGINSPGYAIEPMNNLVGRFNGTISNFNTGFTPRQVNMLEWKGRVERAVRGSPSLDENATGKIGDFRLFTAKINESGSNSGAPDDGGNEMSVYVGSTGNLLLYNGFNLFNRGDHQEITSDEIKANNPVFDLKLDYFNPNNPQLYYNNLLYVNSSPGNTEGNFDGGLAFSPHGDSFISNADGDWRGCWIIGTRSSTYSGAALFQDGEFHHLKGYLIGEQGQAGSPGNMVFDIRYRDGGLFDIFNNSPCTALVKQGESARLDPLHSINTAGHLMHGTYVPSLWKFSGRRPFALILNSSTNELVLEGHTRQQYNIEKEGDLPENTWDNDKSQPSVTSLKLQDMDYYQDYSYEIRSSLPSNNYENAFSKFAHPAGFKYFTKQVDSPDTLP